MHIPTPRANKEAVFPACNEDSDKSHPEGTHVPIDFARQLEKELHICRIALGIQPSESIPLQEPKFGLILVDCGSTRKRISPTNEENIKLIEEIESLQNRIELDSGAYSKLIEALWEAGRDPQKESAVQFIERLVMERDSLLVKINNLEKSN